MPRMIEFECGKCGYRFEYLAMTAQEMACDSTQCQRITAERGRLQGESRFQQCDGVADRVISAPAVHTTDMAGRSRQLKARATDHWNREGKDEAIERTRAYDRKHHGRVDPVPT